MVLAIALPFTCKYLQLLLLLPRQIYQLIATRSVHDISITWSLLYDGGLIMTTAYLIFKVGTLLRAPSWTQHSHATLLHVVQQPKVLAATLSRLSVQSQLPCTHMHVSPAAAGGSHSICWVRQQASIHSHKLDTVFAAACRTHPALGCHLSLSWLEGCSCWASSCSSSTQLSGAG